MATKKGRAGASKKKAAPKVARRATSKRAAPKRPAPKKPAPKKAAVRAARGKASAAPKSSAKAGRLQLGAGAPSFALPDQEGKVVRLSDFAGRKVVVYFYPKDDTPGCTRESCGFQENLGRIADAGAFVVGISRDGSASHIRFRSKYGLTFPLLTDADASVHRAYGAWGMKSMYGKTSEGVIRTTVVVDGEGRIAHLFPNVKVDGHVDAVLAAL